MQKLILNQNTIWDYADGVDFCYPSSGSIIASYTKEEYLDLHCPKTVRKHWIIKDGNYWFMKDGVRIYLPWSDYLYVDDDGSIYLKVK